MSMAVTLLRKAGYSATIAAAVAFSSTAPAAPLSLPDTPLFLSAGAQPNLIMAIDDSSSMDNEVLFPTNDGAAWWRSGNAGSCSDDTNNSFIGCVNNAAGNGNIAGAGRLNFNNAGEANGTWRKYTYLFPNGFNSADNSARRRAGDAAFDHFAIPPLPNYAWARSPTHNASYFDPKVPYYKPWTNSGTFRFNDSNPTAARFDPVFEPGETINLTLDVAGNSSVDPATACNQINAGIEDNHYFKVFTGMTLPEGTCIRRADFDVWERVESGTCKVGSAGGCDTSGLIDRRGRPIDVDLPSESRVAIRYYPATFYLPENTLPDTFGYSGPTVAVGKAPNGSTLVRYEIKLANFASEAQYNAAMRNFANWFTYYRKRHQALRAGLGESFKSIAGLRVDGFTINNRQDVTMASIDDAANRAELFRRFYTEWVRGGGTPNRTAVARIISNFKRTDNNAPVTLACQKNFGMLFTDGFSNSPADGDGINGVYENEDGDQRAPYADNFSGSLADAVMSAYNNPLRSGGIFTTGRVSPQRGCPESGTYSGPLDCNRNLHMNFYAVTLGARGLLFNPDTTPPVDPYANPPTWPTTFPARHPSAVDDLWHATINGRGQLLNARSPQEIATKLQAVLSSITSQTSTAAAASVNGTRIKAGSRLYQPRFDSATWTGQLLAYSINPANGDPGTGTNIASLPAPADRKIYTRNSARQPVEFTWAALQSDTGRVAALDPASNVTEAQRMLNYLRGDETNEDGVNGGTGQYRRRANRNGTSNKLGDIVGSSPLYIAAPPFRYRDSLESAPYSSFAISNRNRAPMIYVGANDGMLHAFYANSGTEAFAYIPGALFPKLRNLAAKDYGHQFYVDAPPSMGDAFFGPNGQTRAWRTVLAGGLNKGGQAVYAIDITNPAAISANSMFLEFTDANDPDLGFTYSQPQIAKLRDNKWYLVFGNGYNSTFDDDNESTTGNAVLFMIDLQTGVARKIDTLTGNAQRPAGIAYDNGLSTPVLADMDRDGIAEAIYAGDLFGNMWKFDVSSTDPSNWGVAFGRTPLFVARTDSGQVQPITVRPEVTRGPTGVGTMVVFGTGKYLESSDKLLTPRVDQSFYGILDTNAAVTYSTRQSALTRQEILNEVTVTKSSGGNQIRSTVRISTDNALGANKGWFIDLVSPARLKGYQGEKQVTNPQIRDNRVIFTTLIPDQDPCGFGGTGWLMELDVRDGSRLEDSPFDLNRDGLFTNDDLVSVPGPNGTTTNGASSGLLSQEGVPQMPTIGYGEYGTDGRPVQYKYMPGSSGNIQMVIENPGPNSTGRQSWRQIR